MNTSIFEPSDEQKLLKDSIDKFLAKRYPFDARRRGTGKQVGWSREIWAELASLGILAFSLPQEHGGMVGGPLDMMFVMEALGRALVVEPFVPTVILGARCIELAGSPKQQLDILSRVADGSCLLALAHSERQARYDLTSVATTARRNGQGWELRGEKFLVLGGDTADMLIVSARIADEPFGAQGLALFLVDPRAPGVGITPYMMQDGHYAANITLADVRVDDADRLAAAGDALPVVEAVIGWATVAVCAEAVGLMESMLELTVDYLKTREQFGVKIGTFQVLQHRAVDMLTAVEQARSITLGALAALYRPDLDERRKMVSAAKVQVGKSAKMVGQSAIQLHGGIGVTMEYKVGHCFLRSSAIEVLFGDAEHHLMLLANQGGLVEPTTTEGMQHV